MQTERRRVATQRTKTEKKPVNTTEFTYHFQRMLLVYYYLGESCFYVCVRGLQCGVRGKMRAPRRSGVRV